MVCGQVIATGTLYISLVTILVRIDHDNGILERTKMTLVNVQYSNSYLMCLN